MSENSTRPWFGRDRLFESLLAVLEEIGNGSARARVATADHAAVAVALACAARETPVVVLVPTPTLADRVAAVIRFLLEHGPVPYRFLRWPRPLDSPWEEVVESPGSVTVRTGTLGCLALSDVPFVLVLDAAAAARRVMPFEAFLEGVLKIETGRTLDLTGLPDLLVAAGYRRVSTVSETGEFAIRGGVADVFSPFSDDPVRIELDGDDVAGIRVFDPATQRAQRPVFSTWIVPAWEVPVAGLRDARIRLAEAASAAQVPGTEVARIEAGLGLGRPPAAFGAMLPILHGRMDLLSAYLGDSVLSVVLDPEACLAAADGSLDDLRCEAAERGLAGRIAAGPEALACPGSELLPAFADRSHSLTLDVGSGPSLLGPADPPSSDLLLAMAQDVPPVERVQALVREARAVVSKGEHLLVVCPSEPESRRVRDVLVAEGLDPVDAGMDGLSALLKPGDDVRVVIGRLRSPFAVATLGASVVPSESVFGIKDVRIGRHGERRGFKKLEEFRELAPGDLVVHRDFGIGRFEGLKEIGLAGRSAECMVLTYKGGDRLYVPVDKLDRVEKYASPVDGATPELDRMGGASWSRRRGAARKAARDIAEKLRAIYACRMAASAHAFGRPGSDFREFEATFPYETTADQERSIEETLEDLCRDRPMDRLVCGDVGFGKTEVAIRAAWVVANEGLQVAVLVPTTLLAEQHRLTFAARLRHTPFVVESLSRFRGGAETRRILDRLKTGGIDIVIGTHRLLSKDVEFRNLGLLVVDEEHRFGVAHKERLRELAANVHTLTLSATPIPRTLHMALSGIRELSVIATPPRDRLAVRTFVARSGPDVIRSAITRELNRGGQVFFVHNRVEDIGDLADRVQKIVPQARVAVAHGQMSADDLESVMAGFLRGEKNVLVCTTIIESGLDIGTANTLLIHRADRLGLAQLYQLRGRVGRASEQAYCYLLVGDPATMTEEGRRRIEAIERYSELSSGFNLAAMDMEIRGAGDVLGAEQSGHMAEVGYDYFMEMIQEAVRDLSGEPVPERIEPDLKIAVDARLPVDYIPDERLRLRFYKRLAGCRDLAEIGVLASEIADRFGRMPQAAAALVVLMRIKVLASELGISSVSLADGTILLQAATGHEDGLARVVDTATAAGMAWAPGDGPNGLRVFIPGTASAPPVEILQALFGTALGRDDR